MQNRVRIVLVTGMSGAGKSIALKTLEDMGYEAVDNIPLSIIPALLERETIEGAPLAIGVDMRSRDFTAAHFQAMLYTLQVQSPGRSRVLFLDCDDEILRRRFSETRRRHPIALDRPVTDGIAQEREFMEPLKESADKIIDTSELAVTELRNIIKAEFAGSHARGLNVTVTSFSFKHGLPRDADLVFDVRFLRNPHYDDGLREFTGRDAKVQHYIQEDAVFAPFRKHLHEMLLLLLPRYKEEGKSYLTIAIGCTGGKHRSVFVAEDLYTELGKQGYAVSIRHRNLEKSA